MRDGRQDPGTCQGRIKMQRDVDVDMPLTQCPSERLPVLLDPERTKVMSAMSARRPDQQQVKLSGLTAQERHGR